MKETSNRLDCYVSCSNAGLLDSAHSDVVYCEMWLMGRKKNTRVCFYSKSVTFKLTTLILYSV